MNSAYKTIKNMNQYRMVASRIEQLKDAPPESTGAQELKLHTHLIVEFEKGNLPTNGR